MPINAGLYARVSTTNGQSVDMQLNDLRQLAQMRGFTITREYCDPGHSGAKDSRPALDQMLQDARRGKFRMLLVWRLDRLGRSVAHLVRLLDDFRAWNIELVSFSEGLDFSTTSGKLMYQLISAFSEFERETIRERVRAGLRNARAKGKRLGRPSAKVNDLELRALLDSGLSMLDVGEKLGISSATVCRRARRVAA
jgi:DNA invertase Pin-like site-specific DNA recombinase